MTLCARLATSHILVNYTVREAWKVFQVQALFKKREKYNNTNVIYM